jgi:hypothetical protein
MVPAFKPVILLVKLPVPLSSDVLLLLVVGFTEVPQHTPLAVTDPPPSDVMLPPETADVDVIEVTAVVVTTGGVISSLQEVIKNNEPIKRIIITGILIE